MKIVIATGEIVGLGEWIIDDTCLVFHYVLNNMECYSYVIQMLICEIFL